MLASQPMDTLMGTNNGPRTVAEWKAWLLAAPVEVQLPAPVVLGLLENLEAEEPDRYGAEKCRDHPTDPPSWTWKERLWTAPSETRIGRDELLEALGRTPSWLYRLTSPKRAATTGETIPHRKLDGDLTFVVGEIRAWLREREDVVVAGPMESTVAERRTFAEGGR